MSYDSTRLAFHAAPVDIVSPRSTGADYHEVLVIAISRAHRWKKLLDEGRYDSIADLARAFKMNRHYLARFLRLTLLAPDIIEAILDGREPDGFSLNRLVGEISMLWHEQHKEYGFQAHTLP